jgi:hypothetical protein
VKTLDEIIAGLPLAEREKVRARALVLIAEEQQRVRDRYLAVINAVIESKAE